jgi:hypothetical protein
MNHVIRQVEPYSEQEHEHITDKTIYKVSGYDKENR